jgi:hypothetical protein
LRSPPPSNYVAFRTPFAGRKLTRGGKGFGRFVAFKVFDEVAYYSKALAINGGIEARCFRHVDRLRRGIDH